MRTRDLIVLLPVLAAAGCGSSHANTPKSSASSGPVNVNLKEWAVAPSATELKAGKVTFNVANGGGTTHEMVVVRTDKSAASLGKGKRVSEAGSVGEVSDLKAGKSASKTFNLAPGHYVLICNLPGHYAAGMHADLTVR